MHSILNRDDAWYRSHFGTKQSCQPPNQRFLRIMTGLPSLEMVTQELKESLEMIKRTNTNFHSHRKYFYNIPNILGTSCHSLFLQSYCTQSFHCLINSAKCTTEFTDFLQIICPSGISAGTVDISHLSLLSLQNRKGAQLLL